MTHFRDVCRKRRSYKVIDNAFQVLIKQYCVGDNLCSANWPSWLEEVFSDDAQLNTVGNKASENAAYCGTNTD